MNEQRDDHAQVMHSIGQLTGAVQAMHQGLTARIEDIKADIRRLEGSQSERMDRIEATLGKRIDGLEESLGKRVADLEKEDKRLIAKTATLSATGGGIGGALAAVAVEVIKRM